MIALTVSGLAVLAGLVSSVPLPDGVIGHGGHGGYHQESYQPDLFHFTYGVHDDYHHTDFSESRSGDEAGNIQGEYSVALPDGRIQHVTYHADGGYGGTVMEVTYSGEAHHPEVAHVAHVAHPVAHAGHGVGHLGGVGIGHGGIGGHGHGFVGRF